MNRSISKKRYSYINYDTFNFLKGVAVILLFAFHFIASPDLFLPQYWLTEFSFYTTYFRYFLNLCVAMFAFLTGYGFWFSSDISFKHSLTKTIKIIKIYWIIYFIMFGIAVGTGIYHDIQIRKVILEIFGLSEDSIGGDVIAFFWYLSFYLAVLYLLPVCYFLILRNYTNILRDMFWMLVFPLIAFSFLGNLFGDYFSLKRFFVDLMLWFPCVSAGCIVAKYNGFEWMDKTIFALKKNIRLLVFFAFIVIPIYGLYKLPGLIYDFKSSLILPVVINMSVIYIYPFIYDIIIIKQKMKVKNSNIICEFGKYSMYMWLFNGIFFNIFRECTQPILVYPKVSLLIILWGLLICFIFSKISDYLITTLFRFDNKND